GEAWVAEADREEMSRPRYLAATAQLPTAWIFDSATSFSTGVVVLNSLVLKTISKPSFPSLGAPASLVSVMWRPMPPMKKGVEVTFLSTLPTSTPFSLIPAEPDPRYAQ